MSSESNLAAHLQAKGLEDVEFWLPKFAERGVRSKKLLQRIEGVEDEYSLLKKSARNKDEKNALGIILHFDEVKRRKKAEKEWRVKQKEEKEKKLKEFKEKLKDDMKERKAREKRSQKILSELDKAQKEGKERHDERVQKLESDIRLLLNISPETWISKDKKLDELIKDFQSHHDMYMSGDVQERKLLDDNTLLQECSGGRALQGVLLTKNLSDQLEERRHLLDLPEEVKITHASENETTMENFHSIHEENNYKKTVDILGRGFAVSVSAPIYGSVAIKVGGAVSQRNEDEEEHAISTKKTYSSSVLCSTFKIARQDQFENSQ